MSIIRIPHIKKYFCMSNASAQNIKLSARARGVLCFLLSNNDKWELRSTTLHTFFPEGRDAIATAFKELIKEGYVQKREWMENNLKKTEFIVHEEPFSNNFTDERVFSEPMIGRPKTRRQLSTEKLSTKTNPSSLGKGNPHSSKRENQKILEWIQRWLEGLGIPPSQYYAVTTGGTSACLKFAGEVWSIRPRSDSPDRVLDMIESFEFKIGPGYEHQHKKKIPHFRDFYLSKSKSSSPR